MIIDLVKQRIPKRFGFDRVNDIQVLTPMHRGTVGAGNLNTETSKSPESRRGRCSSRWTTFQSQRQGHADCEQL